MRVDIPVGLQTVVRNQSPMLLCLSTVRLRKAVAPFLLTFPHPTCTTQSSVLTHDGQLKPFAVQLFNVMAKQFMNQRNPVPVLAQSPSPLSSPGELTLPSESYFASPNLCISPHRTYVWDGYSDTLFHKLTPLHRKSAKLMMPDLLLTTDAKLRHLGLLPL